MNWSIVSIECFRFRIGVWIETLSLFLGMDGGGGGGGWDIGNYSTTQTWQPGEVVLKYAIFPLPSLQ